jgi:hypothetical protein
MGSQIRPSRKDPTGLKGQLTLHPWFDSGQEHEVMTNFSNGPIYRQLYGILEFKLTNGRPQAGQSVPDGLQGCVGLREVN